MDFVPTVYIVNADPIANSLTKQLLATINIFSQDFQSPVELLSTINSSSPSCFLISFLLPDISGIELMLKLRKQGILHPCIFTSPKIEPELIVKAMHAGSYGFIKKPFEQMDFIELIQKALEYDKKINRYTLIGLDYKNNFAKLTMREKAVLELILRDLSAMKIGKKLAISHRTVENHRNKIFSKFGLTKTSEMIRVATIYEAVSNTGLID